MRTTTNIVLTNNLTKLINYILLSTAIFILLLIMKMDLSIFLVETFLLGQVFEAGLCKGV